MTKERRAYKCVECGSRSEAVEGDPAPVCCERPMLPEPLEQCTTTSHPEMARNADEDAPCDDNRGRNS